jgi:putative PIN family toxin of toxin-antitoxin system
MPEQQYRVVLDTNQIVAAGSRWITGQDDIDANNVCRRILICVACSHTGLYCRTVIGEYLIKLMAKDHPQERVIKLIALIMGAFSLVTTSTLTAPTRPRDPDDEAFLLCAIDGNADYLVSDDGDLLALKAAYTKPKIGKSNDLAVVLGA